MRGIVQGVRKIADVAQFTEGPFIERALGPTPMEDLSEFAAAILPGPWQAGKTTLPLHHLHGKFDYVSLDDLEARRLSTSNPRSLLAEHPNPAIIREVQHTRDLLSYIKLRIDAERHKCGRFVLTGSENLLLAEALSESRAGRVAVLKLLPLSQREIEGNPQAKLPWERDAPSRLETRFSFRRLSETFPTPF